MLSYLVPIGLLVLAGFALGLLVGRLAWASSKSTVDPEPDQQEEPRGAAEPAATILTPASHRSTPDPPTWMVREIPSPP